MIYIILASLFIIYLIAEAVRIRKEKETVMEVVVSALTNVLEGVLYGVAIGSVIAVLALAFAMCSSDKGTTDSYSNDTTVVKIDGVLTPEPDTTSILKDTLND